jgi:hypothetical protein
VVSGQPACVAWLVNRRCCRPLRYGRRCWCRRVPTLPSRYHRQRRCACAWGWCRRTWHHQLRRVEVSWCQGKLSVSGTVVNSIEKLFMVRSALLLVAGVQSEWLFVLLDQHRVNVVGMCGRRWPRCVRQCWRTQHSGVGSLGCMCDEGILTTRSA